MNKKPYDELNDHIERRKKELGSRCVIVGHHYQADEVIRHAELTGDSLELSRRVRELDTENIVFCGVYFMGESSALLARPGQKVHLPEPSAECSMALMSAAPVVEHVLTRLTENGRKITPLTYVNSTVGVKGVVGKFGGSVCTSSNAKTMLAWAFDQGGDVLFLPDKNLGANTAAAMGLPPLERMILKIRGKGEDFDPAATEKARLLLWPGFCSIHTRFNLRQIERVRSEYPGVRVIVHPECSPEVVAASDEAGSTSFIINYVENAPAGQTIAVGTEINLVERLARLHEGRVRVIPLVESACIHMAQTTEERLAACLDAVASGDDAFVVRAPEEYKEDARLALERMLRAM